MGKVLPVHEKSYYQRALNHFVGAVERQKLGGVVYFGMLPFVGLVPSVGAAIYTAARTTDRLAVVCFHSLRMAHQKTSSQHQYNAFKNAKSDAVDYFSICIGTALGSVTFGAAYIALLDPKALEFI